MARIGDVIQSSIWVTGDEPPGMRERFEQDVTEAIDYFCSQENFAYGPVIFVEKHPMDEGVPEVPDHVSGSRVRLLIGEAVITGPKIKEPKGSFVANLDKKDLDRLRKITRMSQLKLTGNFLTDSECDSVIEEIGPEAALDTLRGNNQEH